MDKNMLAGLEGLPEEDKARMSAMIDHLQLRDRCVSRSFPPSNSSHLAICNSLPELVM